MDGKRFGDERRYEILQKVRVDGRVEVASLATEYGVSTETVRQDLNQLQDSGMLRRTHGGAVRVEKSLAEQAVAERTSFSDEKRRIAEAAVRLVPETGSIFIESGSTLQLLADSIPQDYELTVFTNSLPAAVSMAAKPSLTVVTLGGRVRRLTLGEVDNFALRSLEEIHVDVAFLGTNGLSIEQGLTTPDSAEAEVKRRTLSVGTQTVLLADRSKVDAVSVWRYGAVEDLDVLVMSTGVDDELVTALEEWVGRVILA
ncbi:MAG: DeoR/GlpR family DNA-binding transcription regulator [Galactobacter sp.]